MVCNNSSYWSGCHGRLSCRPLWCYRKSYLIDFSSTKQSKHMFQILLNHRFVKCIWASGADMGWCKRTMLQVSINFSAHNGKVTSLWRSGRTYLNLETSKRGELESLNWTRLGFKGSTKKQYAMSQDAIPRWGSKSGVSVYSMSSQVIRPVTPRWAGSSVRAIGDISNFQLLTFFLHGCTQSIQTVCFNA